MHSLESSDENTTQSEPPVALPLPTSRYRQCNASKLGHKRAEVERMLLEGESKLKIARALKISPHTVRAVARQLGDEAYATPSGDVATMRNAEPTRKSLADTLKTKAIQAVDAITPNKLEKASPQACAIVADRLLGRADALEKHGHDMGFLNFLAANYGLSASHSSSRLTMEQKVTIETRNTQQPAKEHDLS